MGVVNMASTLVEDSVAVVAALIAIGNVDGGDDGKEEDDDNDDDDDVTFSL